MKVCCLTLFSNIRKSHVSVKVQCTTESVHGTFILSPFLRLRGHYGAIFCFLLNDSRFHLVLDCTCILPVRLTCTVSQIFDPENLNDDLPVLVDTLSLTRRKSAWTWAFFSGMFSSERQNFDMMKSQLSFVLLIVLQLAEVSVKKFQNYRKLWMETSFSNFSYVI